MPRQKVELSPGLGSTVLRELDVNLTQHSEAD
jgi:hypothetical protein